MNNLTARLDTHPELFFLKMLTEITEDISLSTGLLSSIWNAFASCDISKLRFFVPKAALRIKGEFPAMMCGLVLSSHKFIFILVNMNLFEYSKQI